MRLEPIENLKNIGPTIAKHLRQIGIRTRSDLEKSTPSKVYLHLCASFPEKTWPVCYYLYSLEGALRDKHWDAIPVAVKKKLDLEVSLWKKSGGGRTGRRRTTLIDPKR